MYQYPQQNGDISGQDIIFVLFVRLVSSSALEDLYEFNTCLLRQWNKWICSLIMYSDNYFV